MTLSVGNKSLGNSSFDEMKAGPETRPLSKVSSVIEQYSPLSNKLNEMLIKNEKFTAQPAKLNYHGCRHFMD